MKYWLIKSEPDAYSINDFEEEKVAPWDGVRNYQARNFMRDEMKIGDQVLFYHSRVKPPAVVGLAEVASKPYPDPTAFDPGEKYYDPKSKKESPTWILVDLKFIEKFERSYSLEEIKQDSKLEGMYVSKPGMRLSIQPVEKKHFEHILKKVS